MDAEIVEKELWDHYSELPNPAWYDYKNKENMKTEDLLQRFRLMVAELSATTSNNTKKQLLEKWMTGSPDLQKLMEYIYSDYKKYYVTSKNCKKNSHLCDPNSTQSLFELLDSLDNRTYTGHDAISMVNSLVAIHSDYEELIWRIIDRDMKCRVSTSLINKVFPNTIPVFKVALADSYKPGQVDFEGEMWLCSRKLDGVRCLAMIDDSGDIKFYSRGGNEFLTLDNVKKDLKKLNLSNVVLDGELCIVDENGDEDFQSVMKEINKKDHTIENPLFQAFDFLTLDEFNSQEGEAELGMRLTFLRAAVLTFISSEGEDLKHLKVLEQLWVKDSDSFQVMFDQASKNGWEGLMLRKNVSYEGKRSKNLLKVKKFYDAEYTVKGIEFGDVRYIKEGVEVEEEMVSNITIEHKGNKVGVGSGFSMDERIKYFKNPELLMGKTVTIQYFEESTNKDGGHSLRFPVIKHVYQSERNC
jgi:DNA ligase-1|tara:strand:+ start:993 stop:2402 length:1410 start_codon:yes stop_codon:yes gene_type:complete